MPNSYNLGCCNVFWTANTTGATETDLGYTNGGITLNISKETKEIEADQLSTPLDEVITKSNITVSCPFIDLTLEKFQSVFPGSTIITDATTETKKKLVVGNLAGKSLIAYGGQLRLHPVGLQSTDKSKDYLFPLAAVSGDDVEVAYVKDDLTTLTIKYKAFVPTSGTNAGTTLIIGDPSANA